MPILGESNVRQGFAGAGGGYEIENSAVLHDGDTDQFTRTFDIAPANQKKFTVSMWFKRSDLDVGDHLFGGVGASATTGRVQVYFDGSDQLVYEIYHGSGWNTVKTNQVFTDTNAWYNIMIVYDVDNGTSLDKMRVYLNGSRITSFATHNPPGSSLNHLMFSNSQPTIIGNSGDNAYFDGYIAEVVGLDGIAETDMTKFGETNDEGVWIPKDVRSTVTFTGNSFFLPFTQSTFLGADYSTTATQTTFNSASDWTGTTGAYTFTQGSIEAGTSDKAVKSVQTFAGDFEFQWRYVDKANWIIGVYDTAEDGTFNDSNSSGGMASMTDSFYVQASSVAGNNDILYGGSEVVDTTTITNGDTWKIGRVGSQIKVYRNGSVVHTFSQTNSDTMRMVFAQGDTSADADHISWVDGTGTVGKNVFALGSPTQSVDTPTNNFPTHNFLFEYYTSGNTSYYRPDFGTSLLADGNLELDTNSPNTPIVYSNMAFPSSGKFYFEVTLNPSSAAAVGIGGEDTIEDGIGGTSTTGMANVIAYYATNGTKFNQSGTASAYGNASSIANGEFVGVAVDFDNDAIWFCDNGTWVDGNGTDSSATVLAEIVAGTTTSAAATSFAADQSSWFPMVAAVGDYPTMTINFGQSSFTGTAPDGFKTLKTGNLPEPAIKDPTEHVQAVTYTGNGTAIGSGGLSVNQDGNSTFQPDLVWIKNYDTNGNENEIYDSVRGATKVYFPSTTNAESTQTEGLTAFESDGFKVGNRGEVNTSSDGHVAWMWKAADAWNESSFGSNGLASSGRRNTTAGFSIATWTHRTSANYAIKHGLSTTPQFFIIKSRDSSTNWEFWHKDLVDTGKRLVGGDGSGGGNGAEATAYWADASDSADGTGSYADIGTGESPVTATLFALQDGDLTGTDSVMGYFWHGIAGYSKFGTYTGNGDADGIFVELGFKPAILIIRRSGSSGDHWKIFDNKRNTANIDARNSLKLNMNQDHSNAGTRDVNFLSNGFKLRHTDVEANANGGTYIYAAWADTPFGGDGVSEATAI